MYDMENRILEFDVSSATVELAAKALNTEEERIANEKLLAEQARLAEEKLKAEEEAKLAEDKRIAEEQARIAQEEAEANKPYVSSLIEELKAKLEKEKEETGLTISDLQPCGYKDWIQEDGTRHMF